MGRAQRAPQCGEGSAPTDRTWPCSLGTCVPTGCEQWWPGRGDRQTANTASVPSPGKFYGSEDRKTTDINKHHRRLSYLRFVLLKTHLSFLKRCVCSSHRSLFSPSLFPTKLDMKAPNSNHPFELLTEHSHVCACVRDARGDKLCLLSCSSVSCQFNCRLHSLKRQRGKVFPPHRDSLLGQI